MIIFNLKMAQLDKISKYIFYIMFFCAIGCKYILMGILNLLPRGKFLNIFKYNKNIQKRIDININHYKTYSEEYSPIEIDIIPTKGENGDFINIKKEDKEYFHIYFNDNKKEEIGEGCWIHPKNYLTGRDNPSKISIIIDHQIKSFSRLFDDCECIESIEFKKFYRNNITDMRCMFDGCSLKELNLSKFNTDNVINMYSMFRGCKKLKEIKGINKFNTNNVIDMCSMFKGCWSLKELNLNNFNTNNVEDMSEMFYECASLEELKLNNFNTNNVTNMYEMFSGCKSLKELDLSSFNTNKVTDMREMFYVCSSLKELNLSSFNTDNVTDMRYMFYGCLDELKLKIKSQLKNFKEEEENWDY